MHEVIHLSFGPQANALNTEFYNQQQNYFVYTKTEISRSHVDPGVRFVYGREYTPRAGFWDYRNGFGKQKQFQFDDSEVEAHASEMRINSLPTWTDSVEFPIHSSSMHTIPDWEITESAPFGLQRGAPQGQNMEFEVNSEGQEQFTAACHDNAGNSGDYLDDCLRPMLEKCDMLDGVNLVSDLGGWGGFSTEYLKCMRDDFVPKQPIFVWALSRPSPPRMPLAKHLSRVEMLVEMAECGSLVLPLQNLVDTDFQGNARTHLPAFESICLLSSLRRNRVSMNQIVQDLTIELPHANIVQVQQNILAEFSTSKVDTRNTVVINRPGTDKGTDLTVERSGDREHLKTVYTCPQPQPHQQQVQLEINDRPLQLRKLVRNAPQELRELVGDLTDNYVWRWESDSDYSD